LPTQAFTWQTFVHFESTIALLTAMSPLGSESEFDGPLLDAFVDDEEDASKPEAIVVA
jgi:hypothetical protein